MIKLANIKTFTKYCCGKIIGGILVHKLEDAIREAEVISFDIFDTLIKRNVEKPEDVHQLVQGEFYRQTGIELPEYSRLRIDAEYQARKHSSKEEISLEEIYAFLRSMPEDWKSKLKEIERQIELEVCTPNLRMQAVYEKALRAGKKVIITSDMYLDEQTIRHILQKCNYDLYEKLYLSSSFGVCKSRGSIYEIIKKDYSACKGKILHIGDNVKGDYIIPQKRGINALLINGQADFLKFWKKESKGVKNQFLYQRLHCFLNNCFDNSNDATSIGIEILGPMLLGYCRWLHQKISTDKIDKIFFLSREGRILQEAFHILYPQCGIEQAYLYVSRQALVVPQLADSKDFDEMVDKLKYLAHAPSVSMIPVICMLDQTAFNEKLKSIGLDSSKRIDKVTDKEKDELYHIIQELGKDDFRQQKEYIVRYLKENDFAGNVAIVDIGWSGTMQQALQKYAGDTNAKLHGYYLGVRNMEPNDSYEGLSREGYLFDPGRNDDYNLMTRFTSEIIEMLFLNTAGSVLGYDMAEGNIVPVLDKPEYDGDAGRFILSMQSAALEFLNKIKKDPLFKEETEIPEDIIMNTYYKFAVQPRLSTLKIFDGFQVLNGKIRNIIPQHRIFYYMFHLRDLERDFRESSCKIFFLKALFKVDFPYYKILKFSLLKWNGKRE